ncbi:MAG TPA: hypothetical protein VK752_28820 [Bryobacteraceae bacterium]|jgi:hypothetical protein|nr:hypothetical protein [Bryobacteraceae bacterium]
MNNTQSNKSSKGTQTGATTASTSTSTSTSSTPCGCGCGCGCHGHASGCCKLTCFERPSYFCGQLLSDADLTLQENYFREKNKLYHRALDGFGVVCGLRLRCDANCQGRIAIGDGYAIDCCGNDLVVCEPRSYDVIGELRKRKWLIDPQWDPCQGDSDRERGCIVRQCFYIGICYSEEPADYVTPYTTDCSPAPGPCQPTRIREGVRFEIYDKLPVRPNPLTEMEKRIECCFRVFREGQFSRGLESIAARILRAVKCPDVAQTEPREEGKDEYQDAVAVFRECRALFLYELRTCPDPYNCNLEHEVSKLRAPGGPNDPDALSANEAFTRLFELIQKHVFGCVLNELAFSCPDPPENCCVLLGSVEIENGRLTRVINYPRWYLWCFANFFEVLIYTIATDAACGQKEEDEPDRERKGDGCCPTFQVDVCEFLHLFQADHRAAEFAASSSIQAIKSMFASMTRGFDFMNPHRFSPQVLRGKSADRAMSLAKKLNFDLDAFDQPAPAESDPISALLENMLYNGRGPMVIETKEGNVSRATRSMGGSARAVGSYSYADIEELFNQKNASGDVSARLEKLESQIRTLMGNTPPPPEGGSHESN